MSVPAILVVEDDEDIRETLQLLLELEGYSVSTAQHGLAALDLLVRGEVTPALILLDLMMPVMDGVRFLRELRRANLAPVPVIVMTAGGQRRRDVPPVAGWLTKPVELEHLLAEISRVLSG